MCCLQGSWQQHGTCGRAHSPNKRQTLASVLGFLVCYMELPPTNEPRGSPLQEHGPKDRPSWVPSHGRVPFLLLGELVTWRIPTRPNVSLLNNNNMGMCFFWDVDPPTWLWCPFWFPLKAPHKKVPFHKDTPTSSKVFQLHPFASDRGGATFPAARRGLSSAGGCVEGLAYECQVKRAKTHEVPCTWGPFYISGFGF